MGIKTNGTVVTAQTGSANSTVPAEVRRDFEEHEPEVYYDEIEESDYVTDLDEVFDKSWTRSGRKKWAPLICVPNVVCSDGGIRTHDLLIQMPTRYTATFVFLKFYHAAGPHPLRRTNWSKYCVVICTTKLSAYFSALEVIKLHRSGVDLIFYYALNVLTYFVDYWSLNAKIAAPI